MGFTGRANALDRDVAPRLNSSEKQIINLKTDSSVFKSTFKRMNHDI